MPSLTPGSKQGLSQSSLEELSASKILKRLGNLYGKKNKEYSDNFRLYPNVMTALFPHGIRLNYHDDHIRMQILSLIVVKLTRYAVNWDKGHNDSLSDLAVYAATLQQIDQEIANANAPDADQPSNDGEEVRGGGYFVDSDFRGPDVSGDLGPGEAD